MMKSSLRVDSRMLVFLVLVFSLALTLISAAACARTPQQKQARFLERVKKLLADKNYQRAVLEFRNAIQLNLRDPEPYYQMALADLATKDFRGAIAALRTAVDLNPKHFPAQLKLAELMTTTTEK